MIRIVPCLECGRIQKKISAGRQIIDLPSNKIHGPAIQKAVGVSHIVEVHHRLKSRFAQRVNPWSSFHPTFDRPSKPWFFFPKLLSWRLILAVDKRNWWTITAWSSCIFTWEQHCWLSSLCAAYNVNKRLIVSLRSSWNHKPIQKTQWTPNHDSGEH